MIGRRTRGSRAATLGVLAALAAIVVGGLAAPADAATRHVWVAAVPIRWDVVPNHRDAIMGDTFRPADTTMQTVVYRRFTPGFGRPLPNGPGDQGLQGPLIRARVGDMLLVHFRNLDTLTNQPHSMHFHGVQYRPGSDGAFIPGFSGPGANVKPGQTFTYRLVAGPQSAGVWPYHDHSPSMMASVGGGMFGALSILGKTERAPDREFVVFLSSQLGFMTIDGRAFVGNTPVFTARVGQTVQWDVLTLGDDFHTFHVHGHRWVQADGISRDTQVVGPAESFRFRWVEDAPGTWLYHCHVESHMQHGMIGIYRVLPR